MSRRTKVVQDWAPDPWDDPTDLVEVASERPRRPAVVTRVLGITVFGAAMVFILVVGAVGWWTIRQINPPGDPGAKVNFTISATDDVESVATRLQEQGIITNARVFKEYVKRKGGLELRPGYYTVRTKDNMGNIMSVLRTPPALTFQNVTFPEGFTIADMAKRLSTEVTRLNVANFQDTAYTGDGIATRLKPAEVASMEGLLFPDTYQVAGNETEAQVIKRMADRMDRVATQLGIDKPPYAGFTPYLILTIASIIEKEAKVEEDRAKISAVIWNRLSLSMPLEIDATLLYRQDPSTPFAELRNTDTPYNTYLHQGLPPTPISNPGAASIKAALHPAANPDPSQCASGDPCRYLYYVLADKSGKHVFATNLADHDKNVAKARAAGLLG
jgi:UPF0755 protein